MIMKNLRGGIKNRRKKNNTLYEKEKPGTSYCNRQNSNDVPPSFPSPGYSTLI